MSDENRRYERVLQELDVELTELDGSHLDDRAVAEDVSPVGFRVITRAPLEKDQRLAFSLRLMDDSVVRGKALVVWRDSDRWGGTVAGLKITGMSWGDRSRLRGRISRPGYDFVGLARKAAWAMFWIVLAAGVHNVAFHQPEIRKTLGTMLPVIGGVFVLALGLWLVKGSDDERR